MEGSINGPILRPSALPYDIAPFDCLTTSTCPDSHIQIFLLNLTAPSEVINMKILFYFLIHSLIFNDGLPYCRIASPTNIFIVNLLGPIENSIDGFILRLICLPHDRASLYCLTSSAWQDNHIQAFLLNLTHPSEVIILYG